MIALGITPVKEKFQTFLSRFSPPSAPTKPARPPNTRKRLPDQLGENSLRQNAPARDIDYPSIPRASSVGTGAYLAGSIVKVARPCERLRTVVA